MALLIYVFGVTQLIVSLIVLAVLAVPLIAVRMRRPSAAPSLTPGGEPLYPLAECLARLRATGAFQFHPAAQEKLLELTGDNKTTLLEALCVLSNYDVVEEEDPGVCRLPNVLHFDTEYVDGTGTYTAISEALAGLSAGELAVEIIRDGIDFGAGQAELELKVNAKRVILTIEQEEDWFDMNVVVALGALLSATASRLRYILFDTGGQDALVACVTQASIPKLRQAGLDPVVLEDKLPLEFMRVED